MKLVVQTAAPIMGLDNWKIEVHAGTDDNGSAAQVQFLNPYRQARIAVNVALMTPLPNREITKIAVHELVHLVLGPFDDLEDIVNEAIEDRHARKMFRVITSKSTETAIHRIEDLFENIGLYDLILREVKKAAKGEESGD